MPTQTGVGETSLIWNMITMVMIMMRMVVMPIRVNYIMMTMMRINLDR